MSMQPPQTPALPHGEQRSFLPDRDLYIFRPESPLPSLKPVPEEVLKAYAPSDYKKPGFPRVPLTAQFTPSYLASRLSLGSTLEPFTGLQNFEDFFPPQMYEPAIIKNYQTDFAFAEQRLSGVNPMVLRRITHITSDFFTQEDLKKACPSLRLDEELQKGNIYVADYENLSFVQGGTYKGQQKYLPKPLAFFHWKQNPGLTQGELVPLAIQIHQKPGGSIYTPRDNPMDWFVAKLCVQIADGNHHEMSSHLCRTHFVMAPFAIATARKLAINHPLGLLLRPHLRFLLAVNDQGFQLLINPYVEGTYGGHVDRILAGTLQESLGILKNAYDSWDLGQFEIRTELKERGLDDVSQLPHFPYRDDGLPVWEAIEKFVSNFLNYWYPDDEESAGNQKILKDSELQDWAKDLVEEGKVKGMPSPIETVEQLIKIVTNVIFTSGPQHAAVNYPQYDYLAFVPNVPLAAYKKIPESKGEIPDEAVLMEFLPPQEQADAQLKIVNFLSFYRHDRLGYYDESFHIAFMGNPHIKLLIQQFQQDLRLIEQEIEVRNRSRYVPYPYLKPSLIPNSISA